MKKSIAIVLIIIPILLSAYPGEIKTKIKLPFKYPTGMTFDGKLLWVADRFDDKFYCIDIETSKVEKEISTPGYWPTGLAWDGTHIWHADLKGGQDIYEEYKGKIYKINPKTGEVVDQIISPCASPMDLTWDGKYLWVIDNRSREVIQFNPYDGTTIRSFKSPASEPTGITFDGKYLWISDRIRDEIYMVDPETGWVLMNLKAPGPHVRGLAYAHNKLWVVDFQKDMIFGLVHKDDTKFINYDTIERVVTYRHQTLNFGPGKINNLNVYLSIPVNRFNQEIIGEIEYSHKPEILTDQWGQKVGRFTFKDVPAGEKKDVFMKIRAKTWTTKYFIFPEDIGSMDQIPKSIRELYLQDAEKYDYKNPIIQNALQEALEGEQNPYWMIQKIYRYIHKKMSYEMVGGWNTAPTVLARNTGSCSEYTFIFISMCRASGIPARYVGSTRTRGDEASLDESFHRWVEIYLPNFGWVPIDPQGGDKSEPYRVSAYFGTQGNDFLITTVGGGNSEYMEWYYNSNESFSTEPKTYVNVENFSDWEPIK